MRETDKEKIRPLDTTRTAEVISHLRSWINSQEIVNGEVYLNYVEETDGLGFCMKMESGLIVEEDILGNYLAEVIFSVYYKTNATPDGNGLIYKPLRELSEWFAENDLTTLNMGTKRTPKELMTLHGPVDLSRQDEEGNTTFYSIYKLLFFEEAK